MESKQDFEVLIALSWEQAKLIQNALLELGKRSRSESNNEEESEWYREQWAEYIPKVGDLYKGITNQIEKHEEDFKEA